MTHLDFTIPSAAHHGMPGYLRASFYRARLGGASGYETAGFQLGRSADSESPSEIDCDEWATVLEAVDAAINDGQRAPLIAWLSQTFPVILSAVPSRRREQFLDGFIRGRQEAS